ncbi:exo-beta-D-glucosaminidase [Kitasatospora xanthocidica]|uniref:glycoside hydrolase family 2 protein n=1 Tax=Kitasatospora xanthocidica TaxID=83382 RepID=UPI0036E2D34C
MSLSSTALTNALARRGSAVLVAGILVAAAAVGGPPQRARAAAPAVPAVETTAVADTAGSTTVLKGFDVQSSADVPDSAQTVSTPGYQPAGWHRAGPRTTVLAALVADGTYPDPFYSTNMATIPTQPFTVPWWYRSDFTVNDTSARSYLDVTGVVSAADVYVNGVRVATADQIAGMYTSHELDITAQVHQGINSVAFLIQPNDPKKNFTSGWIDWNPYPPDNNMGMVRDISIRRAGAVVLSDAHVLTSVDTPSLGSARLTVKAQARNDSAGTVTTTVSGTIGDITFSRDLTLGPGESRTVTFSPADTPQLNLTSPKIWWPAGMGDQPLYDLRLTATTAGATTDTAHKSFGIRDVQSSLNADGHRTFTVNGHPLMIRGAAESVDLLWRWNAQEASSRITYALNMGLNAIRLEGHLEPDEYYDMADKAGMLLLPGWECCNKWQDSKDYTPREHEINRASMAAVAAQLRDHPSVTSFSVGSDYAPSAASAQDYQDALNAADWTLPVLSSNNIVNSTEAFGPSGMRMGPYEWVPPNYWYNKRGGEDGRGAEGFNSETGAGVSLPTMDTLRRMMTPGELDTMWKNPHAVQYHRSPESEHFNSLDMFGDALNGRYGQATGLDDFVRKAQLAQYEAVRAQFEAYGRNFTDATNPSTGVVYWMLNGPWTSLHWQLFDRYFDQSGAYFGAQKANEDLHIQYSYDDRSVVVVNRRTGASDGLTAHVDLYNPDGTQRFHKDAEGLTVPGDGGKTVALTIPENIPDLDTTYLAKLTLTDSAGKEVSRNVYWLSTKQDVLDYGNSDWYVTPTSAYAALDGLNRLAQATVSATGTSTTTDDGTTKVTVKLTNTATGNTPALLTDVHLVDPQNKPLLPVTWSDNQVSLWPGESTTITATVRTADLNGATPNLRVSGWNTPTSNTTVATP